MLGKAGLPAIMGLERTAKGPIDPKKIHLGLPALQQPADMVRGVTFLIQVGDLLLPQIGAERQADMGRADMGLQAIYRHGQR